MKTLASLRQSMEGLRPRVNKRVHAEGRASILVPLVPRLNADGAMRDLDVILCVRSQNMRSHKGEVCFPGGKRDLEDVSDQETALRETEEEIGVPSASIDVLGRLDQIPSKSFLLVSPFVGLLPPDYDIEPHHVNEHEVIDIFSVPVSWLHTQQQAICTQSYIDYKTNRIWGLTYHVLLRFLQVGLSFPIPESKFRVPWRHSGSKTQMRSWMDIAQDMTNHDRSRPGPANLFTKTKV